MGEIDIKTESKKSAEDAEAVNTATQQNKTNTKAVEEPKVVITLEDLEEAKPPTPRSVFVAWMFGILCIVLSGLLTYTYVAYMDAIQTPESLALQGESDNGLRCRYHNLQKQYSELESKHNELLLKKEEWSKRVFNCQSSTFDLLSTWKAAYDEFVASGNKFDYYKELAKILEANGEQSLVPLTGMNPNEIDTDKIIMQAKLRTELMAAFREGTLHNVNETNEEQTEEEK